MKYLIYCLILINLNGQAFTQVYSKSQSVKLEEILSQQKGIEKVHTLLELSEAYCQFQMDTATIYAKQAGELALMYQYNWGYYKSVYCLAKVKQQTAPIYLSVPYIKACESWFDRNGYVSDAFYCNVLYANFLKSTAGMEAARHQAKQNLEMAQSVENPKLQGIAWFDLVRLKASIPPFEQNINALDSALKYSALSQDSVTFLLARLKKEATLYGKPEAFACAYEVKKTSNRWENLLLEGYANLYVHNGYNTIRNFDSLVLYQTELVKISEHYNNPFLSKQWLHGVMHSCAIMNDYQRSIEMGKRILSICKTYGYQTKRMAVHQLMGALYSGTGDVELSISSIIEAIKIAQKQQHQDILYKLKINLGVLYSLTRNFDKSEAILKEVNISADTLVDSPIKNRIKGSVNYFLSQIYVEEGNYEKSLETANRAIAYAGDDQTSAIEGNIVKLKVYLAQDDLEKTNQQYNMILNTFSGQLYKRNNFDLLEARVFLLQEKYDAAVKGASTFLNKKNINSIHQNRQLAHEVLYKAYQGLKQYDKALASFTLIKMMEDSLRKIKADEKLFEIESEYKISLKEAEISDLQKQQEITDLKLTQQGNALELRKLYNIVLGVGVLLVFLISYMLFRRYRARKEHEKMEMKAKRIKLELENIQALQKAELAEVKNKLFANVSHEFRTPLTLIKVPVQNYMNKLPIADRAIFNGVLNSTDQLLTLVDELLDLGRIESGDMELQLSTFNLPNFFGELETNFSALFNNKSITFNWRKNFEHTHFTGDKNRLKIVIGNILRNAYEHTPEEGEVRFEIRENQTVLEIEITNDGANIPEAEIEHIFERNFRGEQQTHKGFGIGLALSKEIIKLHDGTLTVNNNIEGKVSFMINLPGIQMADGLEENELELISSNDEENDNTKTGNPNLLIVEDNPEMAHLLINVLKPHLNLKLAKNGEEGLTMALNFQPDLILSDVMMPKKDGIELLRSIKTNIETSHIPVILLTAKADVKSRIIGLDQDADDYINKPFDANALLSRIHNLIRQRRQLHKVFSENPLVHSKMIQCSELDGQFIDKVQTVLEKNYMDGDFTVNTFCVELALNRNSVHNKIKAFTNQSTAQYIKNFRLSKAVNLLLTSNISISEVYLETGFNSAQAFNKAFKERYQFTPSQYRKQSRPSVQ